MYLVCLTGGLTPTQSSLTRLGQSLQPENDPHLNTNAPIDLENSLLERKIPEM